MQQRWGQAVLRRGLHQPVPHKQCCLNQHQQHTAIPCCHVQEAAEHHGWMLVAEQALRTRWACCWAHPLAAVWLMVEVQGRCIQLVHQVQHDRRTGHVRPWHQQKGSLSLAEVGMHPVPLRLAAARLGLWEPAQNQAVQDFSVKQEKASQLRKGTLGLPHLLLAWCPGLQQYERRNHSASARSVQRAKHIASLT